MFNCPERNMNVSIVNIYRDTSFQPERKSDSLGINIARYSLSNTSCDYLLKFYVNITSEVNSSYYNNMSFLYYNEIMYLLERYHSLLVLMIVSNGHQN